MYSNNAGNGLAISDISNVEKASVDVPLCGASTEALNLIQENVRNTAFSIQICAAIKLGQGG